MTSSIPRFRLGAYEPLVELASGGMATVYVARQIGAAGFERLVVLKRVHPHLVKDREFTNMFRDEARLASLVRHPNVVSVVDVIENDSELFLVMDYIESTSIATLMRRVRNAGDRLHPAVASRMVCDVLAGLHAAHEAVDMRGARLDVVHRDVSPQNIIVGIDGTSRLIDFGIAKAQNRLTETRTGSIKGKLGYMSPEGAHGLPVDRRADIFSTGVVLFETMTATRLFHGENDLDTLRRISEAIIPSACSIVPVLPPPLDAILQRALARDPEQRFSTALEFLGALTRTIPPAPAHEVAATMKHFCGEHLEARRNDLVLRLEGKVDTVRLVSHDPESVQSGVGMVRAEVPGTEQRIATSADVRERGSGRSVWPTAAVLVAAAGAILGGVTFALGHTPSHPPTAVASATASTRAEEAPSAAAPAATTAEPAAPIDLTINAEAKIDRIEAKGVRKVDLDGKRARIELEPWTGDLDVEVILAGKGGTVHVVAAADGPHELAAKARDKSHDGHPRVEGPRTPVTAPTPRPKGDELHDNPYGGP